MTRRTVLVADDDPMIREVVATLLDLEEFQVVLAEDGEEALALLREGGPDVAVLDQMMPGMTGLEVLRAMQADESVTEIPVVLLTAAPAAGLPADPLESGARAHLEKPFSPLHLIEILESVLGARR